MIKLNSHQAAELRHICESGPKSTFSTQSHDRRMIDLMVADGFLELVEEVRGGDWIDRRYHLTDGGIERLSKSGMFKSYEQFNESLATDTLPEHERSIVEFVDERDGGLSFWQILVACKSGSLKAHMKNGKWYTTPVAFDAWRATQK